MVIICTTCSRWPALMFSNCCQPYSVFVSKILRINSNYSLNIINQLIFVTTTGCTVIKTCFGFRGLINIKTGAEAIPEMSYISNIHETINSVQQSAANIMANVHHAWLYKYAVRAMRKKLSSDGGDSDSNECKRAMMSPVVGSVAVCVWCDSGVTLSCLCWCVWQESGFSHNKYVFIF
jgi:hypothetical protein